MGTHLVGWAAGAAIQPTAAPIFQSDCEVRAEVSPGSPLGVASARFVCGTGAPGHSVSDCETCSRFRGWRRGPGPEEITVLCHWSARDPVHAAMTDIRALVTIAPGTPWAIADALAISSGVHHLPVLSEGKLVGMVSRSDFFPRPPPETPVSARMSSEVLAVAHSATLAEAVAAFNMFKVGCLAVVTEESWLAGILTRGDLRRIGVPEDVLMIRRCARCGDDHGMSSDRRDAARCVACNGG